MILFKVIGDSGHISSGMIFCENWPRNADSGDHVFNFAKDFGPGCRVCKWFSVILNCMSRQAKVQNKVTFQQILLKYAIATAFDLICSQKLVSLDPLEQVGWRPFLDPHLLPLFSSPRPGVSMAAELPTWKHHHHRHHHHRHNYHNHHHDQSKTNHQHDQPKTKREYGGSLITSFITSGIKSVWAQN